MKFPRLTAPVPPPRLLSLNRCPRHDFDGQGGFATSRTPGSSTTYSWCRVTSAAPLRVLQNAAKDVALARGPLSAFWVEAHDVGDEGAQPFCLKEPTGPAPVTMPMESSVFLHPLEHIDTGASTLVRMFSHAASSVTGRMVHRVYRSRQWLRVRDEALSVVMDEAARHHRLAAPLWLPSSGIPRGLRISQPALRLRVARSLSLFNLAHLVIKDDALRHSLEEEERTQLFWFRGGHEINGRPRESRAPSHSLPASSSLESRCWLPASDVASVGHQPVHPPSDLQLVFKCVAVRLSVLPHDTVDVLFGLYELDDPRLRLARDRGCLHKYCAAHAAVAVLDDNGAWQVIPLELFRCAGGNEIITEEPSGVYVSNFILDSLGFGTSDAADTLQASSDMERVPLVLLECTLTIPAFRLSDINDATLAPQGRHQP